MIANTILCLTAALMVGSAALAGGFWAGMFVLFLFEGVVYLVHTSETS
jgi:hypothetical protein